ncbi:ThiF family adenylyltransferase [uncultured Thiodictyon sp.]|jgi:molybdopterin/thiamine biosynthesis adenylyltransferase|uniref:HesA/MoeB/ThiF family protein n=1 Tax=uncultured Thiodictyon sp. TaxID=1846217 RepID=UPI0025D95BE6|nr:ThiF family adenylyltransferase [uncultured Thiodictyon sp.]
MTIFERNIGVITAPQQETLRRSRVTVIGLGGLGGVIAEVSVRSGVGQLVLVDFDTFDRSNLNRQVFAFQDTVGRPKTEVTLEFLRRINPGLEAVLAATVNEDNAAALLAGSDAIVLAADDAVPCIIASRFARTAGIPVIEGWAIPFCNARVFTADTPTLEECYGFPPLPQPLGILSAETRTALTQCMLASLTKIEGVADYYSPAAQERIRAGFIPSFAPLVWFAAVRMAVETVKVLLRLGTLSLAPAFSPYDPINHRLPAQEG